MSTNMANAEAQPIIEIPSNKAIDAADETTNRNPSSPLICGNGLRHSYAYDAQDENARDACHENDGIKTSDIKESGIVGKFERSIENKERWRLEHSSDDNASQNNNPIIWKTNGSNNDDADGNNSFGANTSSNNNDTNGDVRIHTISSGAGNKRIWSDDNNNDNDVNGDDSHGFEKAEKRTKRDEQANIENDDVCDSLSNAPTEIADSQDIDDVVATPELTPASLKTSGGENYRNDGESELAHRYSDNESDDRQSERNDTTARSTLPSDRALDKPVELCNLSDICPMLECDNGRKRTRPSIIVVAGNSGDSSSSNNNDSGDDGNRNCNRNRDRDRDGEGDYRLNDKLGADNCIALCYERSGDVVDVSAVWDVTLTRDDAPIGHEPSSGDVSILSLDLTPQMASTVASASAIADTAVPTAPSKTTVTVDADFAVVPAIAPSASLILAPVSAIFTEDAAVDVDVDPQRTSACDQVRDGKIKNNANLAVRGR